MENPGSSSPEHEPKILCPVCPKCGSEPPYIHPMLQQAMCINEECDVFLWVPWETAAANLEDAHDAIIDVTLFEEVEIRDV